MGKLEVVVPANTLKELEHWRDEFLLDFSNKFGGASAYEGIGAWLDKGQLEAEAHNLIISYSTDLTGVQMFNLVLPLLRAYKVHADQTALFIVIDGEPLTLYQLPLSPVMDLAMVRGVGELQ